VVAGRRQLFCGKASETAPNYLFCLIIAGLNCAFFPTGTVLGVFSFIVLLREPVKQLFQGVAPDELQPVMGMTPPDWR
jgi:hypothetical protein